MSAFMPSAVSAQAGQKTAFRHLLWLADRFDVWFVGFRNETDAADAEWRLREICHDVVVAPVDFRRRSTGILTRPDLPVLVSSRWNRWIAARIPMLERQYSFARVHCEWSQMAPYAALLGNIPSRTIYVHDVVAQWAQRRACSRGGLWRIEALRSRIWERHAYSAFSRIFVTGDKDRSLLSAANREWQNRLTVLPLHYDRYTRNGDAREPARAVTLLFWGALARRENSEAARWLLDEVVPRLGAGVRTVIAGSNPPEDLLRRRSPVIEVSGFLADPTGCFSHADIAVLPVFEGAGVKVKVLECLASGLPVLTTPIGAEGIAAGESDGLFVCAPDPQCFGNILSEWIRNPARLADLGWRAMAWGDRQSSVSRDILLEN